VISWRAVLQPASPAASKAASAVEARRRELLVRADRMALEVMTLGMLRMPPSRP
jgi:hypothetical protein